MAPANAPELCDAIREAALLDPRQQDELARNLVPQFSDVKGLAAELLRRGWLTSFQINKLAAGRIGELTLGPYVLLGIIGEGGMGTVFKGEHRRLKRPAALKVIKPAHLAAPGALSLFQREAEAAARLDHPNIVRIYDANEADGVHFIAMEYVEGADLARIVQERGRLPLATACDYARQVALGLEHAHARGLIHRDFKPSNLLLAGDTEIVKLLDLGIARLDRTGSGQTTGSDGFVGTPEYVAPEQARDPHGVDGRADLYSLGCSLYFLLTGRPPFKGSSSVDTMLQHLLDDPPTVAELRSDVPAGLCVVVRTLMAKRVEDRYATAGDAAAALGPYADPDTGVDWASATGIYGANSPEVCAARAEAAATAVVSDPPLQPAPTPSVASEPPRPARRPRDWTRRLAAGLFVAALLTTLGGLAFLFTAVDALAPTKTQPVTSGPAAAVPPTELRPGTPALPTAPANPERLAAWRILQAGGRIEVLAAGPKSFPVNPANGLPREPFRVTLVDFSERPRITDAALEPLEELTSLRTLNLSGTRIKGSCLLRLRNHPDLSLLNLRDTDVDAEALGHLGALSGLRVLHLGKTTITEAGLRRLGSLRKLKEFHLDDTTLDDRAMGSLPNMPELEILDLAASRVTDAGLEQLTRYRRLRTLTLDNLAVTDAGLEHLEKLPLDQLRLHSTLVTDKGLSHLYNQVHLHRVTLTRTAVTPEGVAELQMHLPKCTIDTDLARPAPKKGKEGAKPTDRP